MIHIIYGLDNNNNNIRHSTIVDLPHDYDKIEDDHTVILISLGVSKYCDGTWNQIFAINSHKSDEEIIQFIDIRHQLLT